MKMSSLLFNQSSPVGSSILMVRIPLRHWLISLLALLNIPVVGYQVLLVTQAPWWDLPLQSLAIWMGAFAFLTFAIIYWLLQAMPWAWVAIRTFYILWSLVSVLFAFQSRATSLAFFSLALSVVSWLYLSVIKREFGRSYLNPKCFWYQGAPEFIPSLKIKIGHSHGGEFEGSVSHIDREGAYAFFPATDKSVIQVKQIKITRLGREIVLPVQVISLLARAHGVGLRFSVNQMNADTKKHLFDFIYSLEGEGFCENR